LEATAIEGAFRVIRRGADETRRLHDISSQAIVPLLGLKPEHRYLDLCSAPGNKTRQALEYRPSLAVACDISWPRLETVGSICPRVQLDATSPLPFLAGSFDRIFIDAPCSGTGTIGRNPEIKWRVKQHDFGVFARRQIQLVEQALAVLAPGGKIVYATCSLEREENEDVMKEICHRHEGMTLEQEMWRLPGRDAGDGFYAAVLGLRNS
jgi:16S rRNA (cytosine967-C5)-methyltransferase